MRYYAAFREKYSGVTAAQEDWKREVLRKKYLRLPTGFMFHWPNARMTTYGYFTESTQVCNYPVQYFATGEIVPIGITILWHKMKASGMESFLVNTVHDSGVAELCPGEENLFLELGQNAMTKDTYDYLERVYGIRFNLPLGTGCEWGKHWSEGEEIKFQLQPPYEPPVAPTHNYYQAVGDNSTPDF